MPEPTPGPRPAAQAEPHTGSHPAPRADAGPRPGPHHAPGAAAPAAAPQARPPGRAGIGRGPGMLLVTLYGVFTVGAASRSLYQLSTRFEQAPLAYLLSAVAALVYAFITAALVRGGESARKAAFGCCLAELAGVLSVGTWTLVEPSTFPDATVWSDYGMGYLFIPLVLPATGLLWLSRSRTGSHVTG